MTDRPVVIDARAAVREEVGGVERWARELVRRLPALRPDRYVVAAPPAALAHRAGQLWEQTVLPVAARRAIVLAPANLAPLAHPRTVVVIHDLAPLRGPEWYGRAYGAWHRALVPRIARRARLVIVPSRFVADELAATVGVAPERVRVVAPGVAPRAAGDVAGALSATDEAESDTTVAPGGADSGAAATPGEGNRPASEAAVPGVTGGATPIPELPAVRPYVLAVGTDSARKNLGLLDELAPRLREAGLDTVIAGGRRGYLRSAAAGGARRLGYVSESDLATLYAQAAVLAMPSLYEGFGLPCIEAMAAGTPVVASNRAALPETCADAALLADPDDREAFATAVLAAAHETDTRDRLIAAGRERAAGFTWERSAAAVDAAITAALGG